MNPRGHEPAISPVTEDSVTANLEEISEKLETITEKSLADTADVVTESNHTTTSHSSRHSTIDTAPNEVMKRLEKQFKAKYEKVLSMEMTSQRTAGNLANSTLLLNNLKKMRRADKQLKTEGAEDPYQEFCYRWIIPATVVLQCLMLFMSTCHEHIQKMIGAKATSKNPIKVEKAKWLNFVACVFTGLLTGMTSLTCLDVL